MERKEKSLHCHGSHLLLGNALEMYMPSPLKGRIFAPKLMQSMSILPVDNYCITTAVDVSCDAIF